jgi:hypothetical protein
MPNRRPDPEEWDEDESDEAANEFDEPDGADEPTVPCPYCERQIHEDAQRCPYCDQYISAEDAPPPRKAWWIIVGALVCLFLVFRWIAG